MKVVFIEDKTDTWPERKLIEAEIHFGPEDGAELDGLKLVGFAIWGGAEGGTYVTLPSRAFGAGNDRRYFDFLRSISGDHRQTNRIKDRIKNEWKRRSKD